MSSPRRKFIQDCGFFFQPLGRTHQQAENLLLNRGLVGEGLRGGIGGSEEGRGHECITSESD